MTAFAAAYLLVVQVLVAGLAGGALANALSLDRALIATLCLPGGDGPSDHEPGLPKAHTGLSCCTAGCPMAAVGTPPATILAERPNGTHDLLVAVPDNHGTAGLTERRASYASRAPPVLS